MSDKHAREDLSNMMVQAGGIEPIHQRWALCVKHAKVEEIVAPFAADAQVLLPNLPPMVGRSAIVHGWERLLEVPGTFVAFREGRVRPSVAGDVAYGTGGYVMEFEGARDRQFLEGKYLTIWRKRQGRWAITFLQAQIRSSGAMFRGQAQRSSEQRRRVAL